MNDGFTEVGGGETWGSKDEPLQPGDQITGEYLGTQHDVGRNKSQMHNLRTDDGDRAVWGSTVLDSRFEQVKVGDTVRVTFTGLSAKPGKFGKPFKEYKVESKPAPSPSGQDVAPGPLASSSDQALEDLGY